jgi:hypothetical protein
MELAPVSTGSVYTVIANGRSISVPEGASDDDEMSLLRLVEKGSCWGSHGRKGS